MKLVCDRRAPSAFAVWAAAAMRSAAGRRRQAVETKTTSGELSARSSEGETTSGELSARSSEGETTGSEGSARSSEGETMSGKLSAGSSEGETTSGELSARSSEFNAASRGNQNHEQRTQRGKPWQSKPRAANSAREAAKAKP